MSIDRLSEDLERFKDPATDITTRAVASDVEIKIVRDGEQRTYFYQGSTGRIDRRDITRRSYISVRSLLASEDFADLSGFADTQRRILSQRQDAYLEPAGLISSGTSSDRVPLDMNTFLHITKPSTKERLQCILIDGPAGVGKTVLIERLVLARAQPPIAVPVLHVTSRGRRLTNLRDALAGTTTNLRAKFVPDEIPVLVRHGLIQVALDGFDEFVDPSGYQDAWAALKDFIRDCGTAGPIILAGRDTFFDQQSFQSQLQTAGAGAEITVVRLNEVSPDAAKDWLAQNGWLGSQLQSEDAQNYLRAGSYMLRPFFLSRIKDLHGWDALRESRQSPQSFIIDEMVHREARLLSAPLALAEETVAGSLETLFETIAEDMAEREAESVPLHYLIFVAEYAFEDVLPKEQMSRLRYSLGSLALFESGEPGVDVRFPHTEIQNRFLARSLIGHLAEGRSVPFLGRIIFGLDRVEAFAERILEVNGENASRAVKKLREMIDKETQTVRFSLNVAALLISSLSRSDAFETDLVLENVGANDVRLEQTAGNAVLRNVVIARLDARNGDLSAIDFQDCNVSLLISDNNSRFGQAVPNIDVIQLDAISESQTLRSLEEKQAWIATHSTQGSDWDSDDNRRLPMVKLFDRICRRFISQVYIRDTEEDPGSFLLKGREWERIQEILTHHQRLKIEHRSAAGQPRPFYFVASPEHLLTPSPDDGEAILIRREVVAAARALERIA
jgi:hypothetical protein